MCDRSNQISKDKKKQSQVFYSRPPQESPNHPLNNKKNGNNSPSLVGRKLPMFYVPKFSHVNSTSKNAHSFSQTNSKHTRKPTKDDIYHNAQYVASNYTPSFQLARVLI
jgi:hypothetical protein